MKILFSIFAWVLTGAVAIAVGLFIFGLPWLAGLNPHFALADWTNEDTTVTQVTAPTNADGQEAKLLSAFYGLDDGLWPISRFFLCPFAANADGMPVIFSHELDPQTIQAGDFRVVSQAGAVGQVSCTTLAPASDEGELRTVLLAGSYGSAADQPATVEIVGNILSLDGTVNFKGATIDVIPLEAGPSLALAQTVPDAQMRIGQDGTRLPWGGGSGCPAGTSFAVRVTWEGGVTKPGGSEVNGQERQMYQVIFADPDRDQTPDALADLGDGDNNHLLCFDEAGDAREVRFPAGFLTDPREDLNPDTRVSVKGASGAGAAE